MKRKKILAFLVAVAVCVPVGTGVIANDITSNISVSAETLTTEDGFEYVTNTTQGYVAITGYSGSATNIVIPSYIDGYPVTNIGLGVFKECKNLTSVTIPSSVTSIDSLAFSNCTSLTSVTIPSSVTYVGYKAFGNCINLETVTIKSYKTTIDDTAFDGCYLLNLVYDYEDEPEVTITTTVMTTTPPTTTTTTPVTTVASASSNNFVNGVYGDVNGDGVTNTIDLLILKRILLGLQ